MHPAKPLSTKIIMSVLTGILASASVLGNGLVLAVIARFKSLRTVPNILLTNLAVVELLNTAINMPLYLIWFTFEASWYRGKTLAIINTSLNRFFAMLNLVSMFTMMTNMYLAISFGLKYLAWMTKKKALICVFLIWFISIMMVIWLAVPVLDIDLGDVHVIKYRAEIFKRGKDFVAAIMALFIICGAIVCFLTARSIKRKRKEREVIMNLPASQAEARLKDDVEATKTIAITIAVYFLSYIPVIVFSIVGLNEKSTEADNWFSFIARCSLELSSAVNPIIYYTRTNRFRSAFKQFLKDPFGSIGYKEKPNGHESNQVIARKKDREIAADENVQTDGNSTRQAYAGKRRNAMAILSIESLKVGDVSDKYMQPDGRELSGEACRSNLQVQDLHQVSEEETIKGGDKEVNKKRTLEKKFKKRWRPLSKVHSLDVAEINTVTGGADGEKREEDVAYYCGRKDIRQDFSGKRRATITNNRELQKVRKTAWQDIEEKQGLEPT